MNGISIANLAYQLGSTKITSTKLKEKYPKWDIDNVKKKNWN